MIPPTSAADTVEAMRTNHLHSAPAPPSNSTPKAETTTAERAPSLTNRALAVLAVLWCLTFAAANVGHLATGSLTSGEWAPYASGIQIMSVVVLLLKLIGAAMALLSLRNTPRASWLLATALWTMAALVVLYALGNVAITVATTTGVTSPSAAWAATGGVTTRTVGYIAFFLAGAPVFTAIAASYHRRRRPGTSAFLTGLIGAPLVLAGLLLAIPAALTAAGLLP